MRRLCATLLAFLALLASAELTAGTPLPGPPPSKTWTFRQMNQDGAVAIPPFKRISRSPDGLIYVGDEMGLWEFDGNQWRRFALDTMTGVTALGFAPSGDIIAGGSEVLSLLPKDSDSGWQSLSGQLPGGAIGVGNFWEFVRADKRWCVRAEPRVFCHDEVGGFFAINTPERFGRMFSVSGSIYVREAGVGLSKLVGRQFEPLKHGQIFAHRGLAALVATQTYGLVAVTNDPPELLLWRTPDDAPITRPLVSKGPLRGPFDAAVTLNDDTIAVAVESGDVVIFALDGQEIGRIRAARHGASDGARALLTDDENGLWVVWNNAVTRLEYPTRVTVFDGNDGITQTPVQVFRYGERIYTVAGGAVFEMQGEGTGNSHFKLIDLGLPSILTVSQLGSEVALGTMSGVRWLDQPDRAILPSLPAFSISKRPGRDDAINIGLRFAIARAARVNGNWQLQSFRKGITVDATAIEELEPGEIWVGSLVGRVIRLRLDSPDADLATADLTEFGAEADLPQGFVGVTVIDGRLVFSTIAGFLRFEEGRFVRDLAFPADETGGVMTVKSLGDDQILIGDPKGQYRLLKRDITGVYRHQSSIFDSLVGVGSAKELFVDESGIVWLATDYGVIRIDPRIELPVPRPQTVLIREISVGDQRVYSGRGPLPSLSLPAGSGIRFGFALPSFRSPDMNQYRSRIRSINGTEPFNLFSNESRRDFTNLPAGELLFEVEATDVAGRSGGIASIPITVIAPWYRRTWAMVAFWIGGIILLLVGVQWRVRALRARSAELERLVAIKTEALQIAATTDPLTGLWNRHRFGQWMRDEVPKINARAITAKDDERVDLITCVIDLDHFKRVNDQHGHAAGDAVLKAVAERLLALRENGDLVFRFGGEEFVYLGVNRHRSEGKKLAEKIVHEIAQINVELDSGVLLDPTASVGWSVYPFYREKPELFTLDFVLGVADRALYLAKQVGRNRAYGYVANITVDELDRTQADWRAQVFNRHTDFLKRV